MFLATERQIALEAVQAACRACRLVEGDLTGASLDKDDRSPVTVADFASQAVVSIALGRAFPDLHIVGEEDASALRDPAHAALADRVVATVRRVDPASGDADAVLAAIDRGRDTGGPKGRFWVLDPIDGTKGFLRHDQYAVALALVEDGRVVLGVLGCPNLPQVGRAPSADTGCLFVAVRGQGAWSRSIDDPTETRIHVDRVHNPARARFCESVEKSHSAQDVAARVAARLGITAPPYRIDSQCKYAAVARGDASIYLRLPTRKDYVEKAWDHAAGWAVVTEAGGVVTDTRGAALDFSRGRLLDRNPGVVATSGPIHGRVVDAVQKILGS
ncbi:MAG: 3'(2'),5'-bisphosphate nucleotidase [Deltaproteobacteria bacterium]|nr:3'(2'),5'-bisphosphate nucleotidase [Deltaproteobacteria bacterium]